MKKLFLFISLLGFFNLPAQQTKILWLGNSYTSVNNLPAMFHDLALSAGDSIIYDSNTPGGYTFQQHSSDATSIQKIYSQKWDYVVLQAQSQEPSFPPSQVAAQTYPYAQKLDSLIHDNNPCTQSVFYMTWGKKYGDQGNCAGYPILCTFEGVASRLRESYLQMAADNNALVSPAGMAWYASWHTDTLINLWQSDNSHPTVAGSYLTACVFYGTIFQKSPLGITYSPISAQTTNDHLQNIAYHTVFDSLENWNIGSFMPKSIFTYTGNETTKTFSFSNLSQNFSSYQWSFGDGVSSIGSGTHTYADTGTYSASLIVFDNCANTDTSSQTVFIHGVTDIIEPGENNFSIYPDPVKNELTVAGYQVPFENNRVQLYDIAGHKISETGIVSETTRVNTETLTSGIYLLKINGTVHRFVKL